MNFKLKKVLRVISKIVLILVGICIFLYFGFVTFVSIFFDPHDVRLTNVTDSSMTISWITNYPMKGIVYYKDSDSFLPGPLSWIGSGKAYDDRDVADAQERCVEQYNKEHEVSEDFVVDTSDYDCVDVEVNKYGGYYTHHVTLKNLDSNKMYYFRIGDGYFNWKKDIDSSATFYTLDSEVKAPAPIYGKIVNEAGEYIDDSVVYIKFTNEYIGKESMYYSSATNENGGWYLDGNNIRTIEGEPMLVEDGQDMITVYAQYQNYTLSEENKWVYGNTDIGYPDIVVSDDWEKDLSMKERGTEIVYRSYAGTLDDYAYQKTQKTTISDSVRKEILDKSYNDATGSKKGDIGDLQIGKGITQEEQKEEREENLELARQQEYIPSPSSPTPQQTEVQENITVSDVTSTYGISAEDWKKLEKGDAKVAAEVGYGNAAKALARATNNGILNEDILNKIGLGGGDAAIAGNLAAISGIGIPVSEVTGDKDSNKEVVLKYNGRSWVKDTQDIKQNNDGGKGDIDGGAGEKEVSDTYLVEVRWDSVGKAYFVSAAGKFDLNKLFTRYGEVLVDTGCKGKDSCTVCIGDEVDGCDVSVGTNRINTQGYIGYLQGMVNSSRPEEYLDEVSKFTAFIKSSQDSQIKAILGDDNELILTDGSANSEVKLKIILNDKGLLVIDNYSDYVGSAETQNVTINDDLRILLSLDRTKISIKDLGYAIASYDSLRDGISSLSENVDKFYSILEEQKSREEIHEGETCSNEGGCFCDYGEFLYYSSDGQTCKTTEIAKNLYEEQNKNGGLTYVINIKENSDESFLCLDIDGGCLCNYSGYEDSNSTISAGSTCVDFQIIIDNESKQKINVYTENVFCNDTNGCICVYSDGTTTNAINGEKCEGKVIPTAKVSKGPGESCNEGEECVCTYPGSGNLYIMEGGGGKSCQTLEVYNQHKTKQEEDNNIIDVKEYTKEGEDLYCLISSGCVCRYGTGVSYKTPQAIGSGCASWSEFEDGGSGVQGKTAISQFNQDNITERCLDKDNCDCYNSKNPDGVEIGFGELCTYTGSSSMLLKYDSSDVLSQISTLLQSILTNPLLSTVAYAAGEDVRDNNVLGTTSTSNSGYIYYLSEYGIYDMEVEGLTATERVDGGDNDLRIFYIEMNGTEGLQMPVDPDNPRVGEDFVLQSDSLEIKYKEVAESNPLDIKKGINIISFDYIPVLNTDNSSKASALLEWFAKKNVDVKHISYFEGGRWKGIGYVDGETIGNDFTIIPGKGYLLYSEEDKTVNIPGYDITQSIPVPLYSGWNLIGVHGYTKAYTAESLLESINSIEGLTADNVSWWPTSEGKYEGLQITDNQVYGLDFAISKLNGYFVRISKFEPEDETCGSIIWHPSGKLNGKCGNSKTVN